MAMIRKCPKDTALIGLYMSGAAEPGMENLLEHLAECPSCSSRFELLRKLKQELDPKIRDFQGEFGNGAGDADATVLLAAAAREKLQELHAPRNFSPHRRFPASLLLNRRFAAAALGIFILAASGLFLSRTVFQAKSASRSPSLELMLLEPVGKISEVPGVFKWTPVLHAESYAIRLTDSSLREIHATGTYLVTEIVIPPEVRSSLREGETYVWEVRAADGASNILAERSGYFILE
jgi:hypothetical protein